MQLREIITTNVQLGKTFHYYELFGEKHSVQAEQFSTLLADYNRISDICFMQVWLDKLTSVQFTDIKSRIHIEQAGYIKNRDTVHSLIETQLLKFKDGGVGQADFYNGSEEGDIFVIKDSEMIEELLNSYTADLPLGFARVTKDILFQN